MTQIVVHDTLTLLKSFFTSREQPKIVFEQAQESLLGGASLFRRGQQINHDESDSGLAIRRAVQLDMVNGQQGWGLFNPLRSRDATDWQFARFEETAILTRIEASLKRYTADFPAHKNLSQIECILFPADPNNRATMMFDYGLSGFSTPGLILIQMWPTHHNVALVEVVLARFFIHTLRQTYHRGFFTLADTLVTEGLAAAYIHSCFPAIELPWAVSFQCPDNWQGALNQIATWCDKPHYSQLQGNTYGVVTEFGSDFAPVPQTMEPDERAYALEIIQESLMSSNTNTIAAHLYGDELISAQGHPAFGLPDYAGFEIGYHLVAVYLYQSGYCLADVIAMPTHEIISMNRHTE